MAVSINGTSGLVFNDASTQNTAAKTGMVNRIINGAMVIDQRNAGASVTPANGQYLVDRFYAILTQASKFTVQQNAGSVTPPVGFTNYLGVISSSAYSVGTSDIFAINQGIEGFNTADLSWGTVSATSITISFWVRSSLTGVFGGALRNAANNRSYAFTYTISSANTWEQKTVTIAGDTTGTWATNNTAGIYLSFGLGVGSTYAVSAGTWGSTASVFSATGATSVVGTSGATFYITGVQLEKGSTETSFDYRPYGTELTLCQRYCPVADGVGGVIELSGYMANGTGGNVIYSYPVTPRTLPTGITVSGTYVASSSVSTSATLTFQAASFATARIGVTTSGQIANTGMIIQGSSAKIIFNGCEL